MGVDEVMAHWERGGGWCGLGRRQWERGKKRQKGDIKNFRGASSKKMRGAK